MGMQGRHQPPLQLCRCLAKKSREQRHQQKANQGDAATGHELFYTQLGVKLCSMAGGGVALIGMTLVPLLSGLFG